MNSSQLKQILSQHIKGVLSPLLSTSNKVALMDAPYHNNNGDILIYEGELAFLKEQNIDVIYTCSYDTCIYPKLDNQTVILFHGGGNLGDYYHEHMEFLISLTVKYPYNRIVVLPQTIFYKDKELQAKDFYTLLKHRDLYICARDGVCYNEVLPLFGERAFLVPDMAFCIPDSTFRPFLKLVTKNKIYVDRVDREKSNHSTIDADSDVSDWPVFQYSFHRYTFVNKILSRISKLKLPVINGFINYLWDLYFKHSNFCSNLINDAVSFLSPYKKIKTTRLHGCILSILLEKDNITLINNSYGKNKNFYDSWLSDLESVKFE